MKSYLTVDIGTGSIRISIYNSRLEVVDVKAKQHEAGHALDMNNCWKDISGLVSSILAENPEVEIAAIAVSSLLGWVAVDAQGNAVSPGMTYMDKRPKQFIDFCDKFEIDSFYKISGRKLSAEMGGLKLLALKDEQPEVYKNTKWFLTLKDFINLKLTGEACTDHTFAGYFMTYDIRKMAWSEEIINTLGVDASKLPELKYGCESVGSVSEEIKAALGIKGDNIQVAVGGPDGSVGVFGALGNDINKAVNISGSTDVLFIVTDKPVQDEHERIVVNPYLTPGLWLLGGPTALTGGTIRWLQHQMNHESSDLSILEKESTAFGPGANGVIFIPSLEGDRTPYWQPEMRGSVFGIREHHTRAHLFRAILEANAYTLKDIMAAINESGAYFETVKVLGGGSKNDLWMQIKASVLNLPVEVSNVKESTSRGCAMIASIAALDQQNPEGAPISKTFEPDDSVQTYDELYQEYRRIHKIMSEFYTTRVFEF